MIQALLRWKTDQSLVEYRRLTHERYAAFLAGAAAADLTTVTVPHIPTVDPHDEAIAGPLVTMQWGSADD